MMGRKLSSISLRMEVANSSDVTLVYREDGEITYVSPSIERVMGYDPAEQVGRAIREFIHPDDLLMAREWLDELLSAPGRRDATGPAVMIATREAPQHLRLTIPRPG